MSEDTGTRVRSPTLGSDSRRDWRSAMTLSDVTLAITSFCRWGYLKACLDSIRLGVPEAQVIVADDSFDDRCAAIAGSDCTRLAPDSGLTQKRNAIVAVT